MEWSVLYLTFLCADVTSYPVMPWVIQDYQSLYLDLTHPASFRDLSLPMGALTAERRAAATERYQQMELAGEKPFQFGTHYSSSMIVCSYNIRLSPFTEMFLALQGGTFDLADRLFSSVPRAWASASNDNRGDVRELISEFFYNPLFLTNLNAHDFGKRQASDEIVNDVELPPWALGDPLLFIHRMREVCEPDASNGFAAHSEYCTGPRIRLRFETPSRMDRPDLRVQAARRVELHMLSSPELRRRYRCAQSTRHDDRSMLIRLFGRPRPHARRE